MLTDNLIRKSVAAGVAGSMLIFSSSLSWGFDDAYDNSIGMNGYLTEPAIGLELRGLFNSFPFSLDNFSLNAVNYTPVSGYLEDKPVYIQQNELFSVQNELMINRLPLFTLGEVKYKGVANLIDEWGKHGFDIGYGIEAMFADGGVTLMYIAGGAVLAGGAAAVATSGGGSSDDSSSDDSSHQSSSTQSSSSYDDDHDDDYDDDYDDDHDDDYNDDYDDDHHDDD